MDKKTYQAPAILTSEIIRFETVISSGGTNGHWEFVFENGFWKRVWVWDF